MDNCQCMEETWCYLVIKRVYGKSNKTALSEMAVNLVLLQYRLKIVCHLVKNVVLKKRYCIDPPPPNIVSMYNVSLHLIFSVTSSRAYSSEG